MLLNDASRHRQAQPRADRLGAKLVQGLKQARSHLWRNTRAIVLHGQLNHVPLSPGGDGDRGRRSGMVVGIGEQIGDHLLQPLRVTAHRQCRRSVQLGAETLSLVEAVLRAALLPAEPDLAARLATPPALRFVPTTDGGAAPGPEPGGGEARGPVAFLLPYGFAMILYVTIFTAASYLLQSVTEEKENRTIEIVLTSLRPLQLLAGKVLGLGLLGLLQVAVWLGAGLLLLRLSGVALPADAIGAVPWVAVALAIVYFALGYLVYGSLLAAVGATVTNVREGSQLVLLLVVPCIVPLWFLSAIIARPNGLLATALSLFPLTAPITMMIRVPLTPIAAWEIGVSLAVLAASAALCLWLAARLFRAGALLAGQRLSARAVLRALRAG